MINRFEERYKTGDLPWNIKRPDFNLVNTIKNFKIKPGKGLDVGCGTGDNVIWLSKQDFKMTGIDYSSTAIQLAQQKTKEMDIEASFHTLDFLTDQVPGGLFSFVFDRGCFHTFDSDQERSTYARNVHRLLEYDGLWLTLAGNYDDGRLDIGPPKRKALQIIQAVEPCFNILSLVSGRFDSNDAVPSKIWICLMQKRHV
jgi:ubiquinone/menaquinone biosynthesis C-methylase UbiE